MVLYVDRVAVRRRVIEHSPVGDHAPVRVRALRLIEAAALVIARSATTLAKLRGRTRYATIWSAIALIAST